MKINEFLDQYETPPVLITAENGSQEEGGAKAVESSETPTGPGPRYYKSRTAEQWRAYHREYYRAHVERRREQKRASHQRMALVRAYAMYGGFVPKRVIRMLFLREGSAAFRPKKSAT